MKKSVVSNAVKEEKKAIYLISARKITKGHFVGEPGDICYIKTGAPDKDYSRKDIKDYVPNDSIAGSDWFDQVGKLANSSPNPFSTSPKGDVLVFVHGYNNDIKSVLWRQWRLQEDLNTEGWRGIVVGFDWPSEDSTLNYLEDRSDAAQVASLLVTKGIMRLAAGQKIGCETNVHLLGHSTGAYVIMEAFAQAEKNGGLFKQPWRVGQVAFIGGDVASSCLRQDGEGAAPLCQRIMRLTNYSNPHDKVLAVSNAKRLGTAPRAGRVGLPDDHHPKAVDVNCGPYFSTIDPDKACFVGTFNHSWHIGNRVFARDLAMVIEGGIDRWAIPTREQISDGLILRDAPRAAYEDQWNKTRSIP